MDASAQKINNTVLIIGVIIAASYYPLGWMLLFAGRGLNVETITISRFFIWGGLLLLFIYAHKAEKQKLLLWDEQRKSFSFYLLWFLGLYLLAICCGAIASLIGVLGHFDNESSAILKEKILNKSVSLSVFTCLTAGFTEELICRGYVLPRLVILFQNKFWPSVVSALIFSLNHFSYWSITELISTFLLGFVFAMHYQKYRNIKILIVFHVLLDFNIIFLPKIIHWLSR